MKVLLTGSNGFVGCHLAALLKVRGHHVVGLDANKADVPAWLCKARTDFADIITLGCDITNMEALTTVLKNVAPEVVIHLAARPGVADAETNPGVYEEVNVKGVVNLISACRVAKVRRIVHASSSSVYGSTNGAIVENQVLAPLGHYGRTKVTGEQLLENAATSGDFGIFVLRPFSVIGPLGRPDMAPWRFAESLLKGASITVHEGASRDFTSVQDIALAFALAAETKISGYQTINVGAGQPHSAAELVTALASVLACKPEVKLIPLPSYMPMATHADITKAFALLGWRPRITFSQAVTDFGEWFLTTRAH